MNPFRTGRGRRVRLCHTVRRACRRGSICIFGGRSPFWANYLSHKKLETNRLRTPPQGRSHSVFPCKIKPSAPVSCSVLPSPQRRVLTLPKTNDHFGEEENTVSHRPPPPPGGPEADGRRGRGGGLLTPVENGPVANVRVELWRGVEGLPDGRVPIVETGEHLYGMYFGPKSGERNIGYTTFSLIAVPCSGRVWRQSLRGE